MKIVVIMLVIMVIVSGCGSNKREIEDEIKTEISAEEIPIEKAKNEEPIKNFVTIEYDRLNILKTMENVENCIKKIVVSTEYPETYEEYNKAKEEIIEIIEMWEIAKGKYITNCTNNQNKMEINFWINNLYYLDKMEYDLDKALKDSLYGEAVIETFTFYEKEKLNHNLLYGEPDREISIENNLKEIENLKNTYSINSTYKKAYEAFIENEKTALPKDKTIDELLFFIKRKNELAEKLNFKSYYDLIFAEKKYSETEFTMLKKHIKEIGTEYFKALEIPKTFIVKSNISDLEKELVNITNSISSIYSDFFTELKEKKTLFITNSNNVLYTENPFYLNALNIPLFIVEKGNTIQSINDFMKICGSAMTSYNKNSPSNLSNNAFKYGGAYGLMATSMRFYPVIFPKNSADALIYNNYCTVKDFLLCSLINDYMEIIFNKNITDSDILFEEFEKIYKLYFDNKNENTLNLAFYIANTEILNHSNDLPDKLIGMQLGLQIENLSNYDSALATNRLNSLFMTDCQWSLAKTLNAIGLDNPFNFNSMKKLLY